MCTPIAVKKSEPLRVPSLAERYTAAGICCAFFSVWWKFAIVPADQTPGVQVPMHSWHTPLALTVGYIVSLPLLSAFTKKFLSNVDVKVLLKESMILYNISQVALNGWMVWSFVDAVVNKGHPFIGDIFSTITTYATWVHYCDKYLEFFDTYFMVLRGRMDQVSFLHVYHHFSIAWAWWAAMTLFPGGDSYFGALLNSWIHVLMYSYYLFALLKISCPWKRFLTQAQLLQFTTVVIYSFVCINMWSDEEKLPKHRLCILIQVWEMSSLFILFSFFYMRSYGKMKNKKASSDDQCQKAVKDAVAGAAQVVEAAAKDASKFANTMQGGGTKPAKNVRPM
mmetsp:Transcript_21537/g.31770  ORF Transcript_21537/g.31770 Transcript_21537/m.31770 type:complete len:337 (+) Transcript_21537:127-1137(+)